MSMADISGATTQVVSDQATVSGGVSGSGANTGSPADNGFETALLLLDGGNSGEGDGVSPSPGAVSKQIGANGQSANAGTASPEISGSHIGSSSPLPIGMSGAIHQAQSIASSGTMGTSDPSIVSLAQQIGGLGSFVGLGAMEATLGQDLIQGIGAVGAAGGHSPVGAGLASGGSTSGSGWAVPAESGLQHSSAFDSSASGSGDNGGSDSFGTSAAGSAPMGLKPMGLNQSTGGAPQSHVAVSGESGSDPFGTESRQSAESGSGVGSTTSQSTSGSAGPKPAGGSGQSTATSGSASGASSSGSASGASGSGQSTATSGSASGASSSGSAAGAAAGQSGQGATGGADGPQSGGSQQGSSTAASVLPTDMIVATSSTAGSGGESGQAQGAAPGQGGGGGQSVAAAGASQSPTAGASQGPTATGSVDSANAGGTSSSASPTTSTVSAAAAAGTAGGTGTASGGSGGTGTASGGSGSGGTGEGDSGSGSDASGPVTAGQVRSVTGQAGRSSVSALADDGSSVSPAANSAANSAASTADEASTTGTATAQADVSGLVAGAGAGPVPVGSAPTVSVPVTPTLASMLSQVPGSDAADQVVRVLSPLTAFNDGEHQITLSLTPDGMGAVRAQVTVGPDSVVVHLSADVPQTQKLLQEQLPQLQQGLGEGGLKAEVFLGNGEPHPGQDRTSSWTSSADGTGEGDSQMEPATSTQAADGQMRMLDVRL